MRSCRMRFPHFSMS